MFAIFLSEYFNQNMFCGKYITHGFDPGTFLHQIVAGHFFVRSTDLLSLPNVNPDSAFGMQVQQKETEDAFHLQNIEF